MKKTVETPEKPMFLVVEDDPDLRFLLVQALELEDYSVKAVSNGKEALKLLTGWTPHFILLDLSLPEMSGEEFMQEFRRLPLSPKSKVILVSGWDHLSKRAAELGADGYLRKPVDLQSLTDHLSLKGGL